MFKILFYVIFISLVHRSASQNDPNSPTNPSSSPSSIQPTSTNPPPDPNNPSPTSSSPSPATGSSPPSALPNSCNNGASNSPSTPGVTPSGAGGSGTADTLPCIKNFLELCTSYNMQFNKVSSDYGCTAFTNTYIFAFHDNLVSTQMECDTVLQLEVMRQQVATNKGQIGPSTHAY